MLQKMSSGKQNEKLKRRATKMLGKKEKIKKKCERRKTGGMKRKI